ncbi:Sphingosine N-acyltransferase-like protein [Colletotrichum sp. SAR 10_70]|nr:Sphingosine N-acyltransferase-like protein [Colletotrichum sp. SAR 10_71]KAI8169584.1 Sphingosine N-acyltransferase-like protein [Colletotrichum sp. SAR 10_70]KAI8172922.1 Sphingosine N-acyltransferase-like protein [Colletotrichum sp. SAR 10_65]KAI8209692.1 Sphingosine N-acyltransferase-like protein [Colletotrichum sp. SAR 10_76]
MADSNDVAHLDRASVELRFKKTKIRKLKRKGGRLDGMAQWLLEHQTGLAFHTVWPLFLVYIFVPTARPFTSKFFELSYYNPNTGKYGAGHNDLCFVALCVVLCIGIRASLMNHVLSPLGRHWGIKKEKDETRFAEQGWMLTYYVVFWPLGMVISVNIEEKRKDYVEMLVHHAITLSLIAASYAYHQTRVGHLILVLMDVIELIFPLAKCLKYIGFKKVCDVVFGVFLFVWVCTRHVFYLMVCWSVYYDLPKAVEMPCFRGAPGEIEGPFPAPTEGWSHLLEPFKDPAGTVCFTDGVRRGFLTFLLALEVVICAWSYFIIRVTVRVLKGASAEDVRSDVEEAEETEIEYVMMGAVEKEVGVESIDLKAWEFRHAKKSTGSRITGARLRSHSDRKDFLNRIGCEKQID